MFLADHLFKSAIAERGEAQKQGEFKVFVALVKSRNNFDDIKLSTERSAHFQTCTTQDPVLMTFKTTVITEWPEDKCSSLSVITGCVKTVSLFFVHS